MRLQQKAVLFTLPLILIPTLVLGWLSLTYTQQAQNQIEQSTLQEEVDLRTDTLANFVESNRSALISMVNGIEFMKISRLWSEQHNEQQLLDTLQTTVTSFFASFPNTVAIKIYDNKRNLIHIYKNATSAPVPDVKLLLSHYKDWFLIEGPDRESMYSVLQTPWFINTGSSHSHLQSLGFVQLISKPNWVTLLNMNSEDSNSIRDNHRLIISDKHANIVMAMPIKTLGSAIPKPLFEKLKVNASDHGFQKVSDENEVIHFASRLVENEYYIMFGTKLGSMLNFNQSYLISAGITILLTLILCPILLHYGFSKVIVSRIERLATAKRQVAQGDLDIKIKSSAEDEIGDLFASFNVMVRQLIVYRENERESRLRLEYKVKERTEELEQTNHALGTINTELESAKELSEQANELKSAFVANISHEIRTPLTAILGFTEQVLSTEIQSIEQKDLLNRVLKSGRHLLALINDILDLSKIESNKLDLEFKEFCLFQALADVESILMPQAQSKGLNFNFDFDFPVPRNVISDETRLKQILFNLISNAIKFTNEGGVDVKVKYLLDMEQMVIIVKDTGIGMAPEVQSKIFAPFVQADVSISRKFGGTGLGLVISKSLASLLGGDISLKSEHGKGSEFTVSFNIRGDDRPLELELISNQVRLDAVLSEIQQDQSTKDTPISGRVLVAEDVEDNQHLFGLILKSVNLDYVIVENGQKAVERALTEDFDLILMDMQMPIMGGLEATKLIRQAGIDTPIYALTANIMTEDVVRHTDAGCSGTIGKPIDKQEFVKVLNKELAHSNKDTQTEEDGLLSDELMTQLTEKYLEQLMEQVALIHSYSDPSSLGELKAECHKIKGSAGSYGFMDLTNQAGLLEDACKVILEEGVSLSDVPAQQWQHIQHERDVLINLANKAISDFRAGR